MARAKLPGLPGSGPLISVILPAYNVEAYVRHTLESLRRQSYHHLEVLMVDDGSTDGTHAILSEYADLDRRFILVSRANGGLSAARNTGLEKAKGEWIAFCDGDDEMLPRAIEILYQTAVRLSFN